MGSVLLTWELGAGLGHLVNLLPLARGLAERGHRVTAMLRDLSQAEKVFTGTTSNATFDVLQFSLKLVMDQRDIPHLIEKLTTNTFHTLLRVAYHAVPVNRDMVGKIYGPEPAVVVVMDFETVMLGEVFRPLMPRVVCERLVEEGYSIVCPELAEDEEEEG